MYYLFETSGKGLVVFKSIDCSIFVTVESILRGDHFSYTMLRPLIGKITPYQQEYIEKFSIMKSENISEIVNFASLKAL